MVAMEERWPYLPKVWLYHDRDKCARRLRRMGLCNETADVPAQTWYHDGRAVVLMAYDGLAEFGEDGREVEDALLVHEAYHVVYRHVTQYMGEDEAGEETMAYGVQVVAQHLMTAHHGWRGRTDD